MIRGKFVLRARQSRALLIALLLAAVPAMPSYALAASNAEGGSDLDNSSAGASCDNSPVPFETRAEVGAQMCNTMRDQGDAHDPCNMAAMYSTGMEWELVAGTGYAIAAGFCTAECFWKMPGSCNLTTGFVAGQELLGALILWGKGNNTVRNMLARDAMTTAASVGANVALGGKPDKESGNKVNGPACMLALVNAGQSVKRFMTLDQFGKDIQKLHAQKWCMVMQALKHDVSLATTGSGAYGVGSPGGVSGDVSLAMAGRMTPAQAAQKTDDVFSRMTAQQHQFFSEAMNQGGVNGKEIMASALTGKNTAYAATANALAGTLGEDGRKAARDIEGNSKQLANMFKKDLDDINNKYNPRSSSAAFATVSGGAGRSPSKEANPLAGFGEMLSQFMPGQKQAEQDKGGSASAVHYGTRGPAAALAAREGLHTSDRSLFDVIGARYQRISQRFLAGEDFVGDVAPAALPRNPYLPQ